MICKLGNLLIVISIHAAREGGDQQVDAAERLQQISIHAAREGGDSAARPQSLAQAISIHAAREGGDADGIQSYKLKD